MSPPLSNLEARSRLRHPQTWAKIDAWMGDDDWNGGTAASLRAILLREEASVVEVRETARELQPQAMLLDAERPADFSGEILGRFRISDRQLLERAVRYCRPRVGKARWSVVMDVFALGSTAARTLCLAFGLDPDERHTRKVPRR